jgi:prepilin-type N-terminal cleavage/methylation domain-containing protein/uncharacterized repeat protein (TIGR02543 family)
MTKSRQKRSKSGFTLVEIIIVIAVLGILAMIAIPRYAGFTLVAKNGVDNANARMLTRIAHAIEAKTDEFPVNLEAFNVQGEYLSKTIVPVHPENSFSYDSSTGTVTVVNSGDDESEPPEEPEEPSEPEDPEEPPVNNEFTITFDSNGGSAVPSITQEVGSSVSAPAAPTRTGYTFTGWSPSVPMSMPEGGATLTAQWSENVTATEASVTNRTVTHNGGAGGSRIWTITVSVTINLSNGTTYNHGQISVSVKQKEEPTLNTLNSTVSGTTTSGVSYNEPVKF